MFALAIGLVKELSGEAAVDRAQQHTVCCTDSVNTGQPCGENCAPLSRGEAYVASAKERFQGIRRCC
jgi:hypothetical protein